MEQTDEEIVAEVEGMIKDAVMGIYETMGPEISIEDKVEAITMLFNLNMDGIATIEKFKVREILDRNIV